MFWYLRFGLVEGVTDAYDTAVGLVEGDTRIQRAFARNFYITVRCEGVGRRQHGYEEHAHGYGPQNSVFRLALEVLIYAAATRKVLALKEAVDK